MNSEHILNSNQLFKPPTAQFCFHISMKNLDATVRFFLHVQIFHWHFTLKNVHDFWKDKPSTNYIRFSSFLCFCCLSPLIFLPPSLKYFIEPLFPIHTILFYIHVEFRFLAELQIRCLWKNYKATIDCIKITNVVWLTKLVYKC